jgi:hypothetical protein
MSKEMRSQCAEVLLMDLDIYSMRFMVFRLDCDGAIILIILIIIIVCTWADSPERNQTFTKYKNYNGTSQAVGAERCASDRRNGQRVPTANTWS